MAFVSIRPLVIKALDELYHLGGITKSYIDKHSEINKHKNSLAYFRYLRENELHFGFVTYSEIQSISDDNGYDSFFTMIRSGCESLFKNKRFINEFNLMMSNNYITIASSPLTYLTNEYCYESV